MNPADIDVDIDRPGARPGDPAGRKRRGYPVQLGHAWAHDVVDVLVDQYFPFIDRGYELDSLVNHFIGGQGFDFDHPALGSGHRKDVAR